MKNINEYLTEELSINESIFIKKIKNTNIPVKMPDEVKSLLTGLLIDVKSDIKNENDIKDYLIYSFDKFWDFILNEYKINTDSKDFGDIQNEIISSWYQQIIAIWKKIKMK